MNKKRFSVLGLALGVLVLMSLFAAPVYAASDDSAIAGSEQQTGYDTPQAVLDTRPGVVRILATNNAGDGGTGTGFAVGTEENVYIATNYHVAGGMDEIFIYYDTGKYVEATAVVEAPERDLCILKPKKRIPDIKILPLETELIDTGMAVYALGYPAAADGLAGEAEFEDLQDLINSLVADKQSMTLTNGVISAIRETNVFGDGSRKVKMVQTNAAINHGNSGGPLLNRSGHVIAVNTLGYSGDIAQGVNTSVHVDELIFILRKAKIEYTVPVEEEPVSSEPEPEPKGNTGLVIGLVIGGILVVGAVVVVLLMMKKRKAAAPKGVSLSDFEAGNRRIDELAVCNMTIGFLHSVNALAATQDVTPLLTPGNVVIGEDSIALRATNAAAGKTIYPGYTAPESYRGMAGPAAGVYFTGAMMYTLITGTAPADGLARLETNSPLFQGGGTLRVIINQAAEPYEQNRIQNLYQLLEMLNASYGQIANEKAYGTGSAPGGWGY